MSSPTIDSVPASSPPRPETVDPNTTRLPVQQPAEQQAPRAVQHGAERDAALAGGPASARAVRSADSRRTALRCSPTVCRVGRRTARSARRRPAPSPRPAGPPRWSPPATASTWSRSVTVSGVRPGAGADAGVVVRDDVAEDHRVGPAVGDDVVHRLDQPVLGRRSATPACSGPAARAARSNGRDSCSAAMSSSVARSVGRRRSRSRRARRPRSTWASRPSRSSRKLARSAWCLRTTAREAGAQRVRVDRSGQLGDLLHPVGVACPRCRRRRRRGSTCPPAAAAAAARPRRARSAASSSTSAWVSVDQREVRRGVPGQGVAAGQRGQRVRPQRRRARRRRRRRAARRARPASWSARCRRAGPRRGR